MRLADLPQDFRARAVTLREDGGAEQPAVAWERAARVVEEALEGHLDERLTLEEASIESGYSLNGLRRLVREKKMAVDDDRMVLRRHLPKKPGFAVASSEGEVSLSLVQLARTVANGD